MKVLLISPRDAYNRRNLKYLMGGENTYTRTLLKYPPPGVTYIFYADALQKKQIQYSFLHQPLQYLIKAGILALNSSIMCFTIKEHFDLIHVHGYGARIKGKKIPVVLSDSSSNYLFLRDYLGWGNIRIRLGYALKRIINVLLDIYDQNFNLKDGRLIVWSSFAKKVHQDLGCNPEKITVIPPGIPKIHPRAVVKKSFNILFVGTAFKRKGGEILLALYKQLKLKYPNISLSLVGDLPADIKLPKDIWHKKYVPREDLIKAVFPKADVLVDVPPIAEGYGVVVIEAASMGIPAIVSSVYALPELVEDGITGFVVKPGSVVELTIALETLINNPSLRKKMGKAASRRFSKEFSIQVTNKKLLEVYKETLRRSAIPTSQ